MIIGITYTASRYENYPRWIKDGEPAIEVIQLNQENKEDLIKCGGIVLSGGVDTHPRYYNNDRLDYPNASEQFNEERDEFEMMVFNFALKNTLPVLAICRGMQLVNIVLGGKLIQDIQEEGKNDHRRHGDVDGLHEIKVVKDSLLFEAVGQEQGLINSAHHQALDTIAPELIVNAWSPDGIAEGAEWKNSVDRPFLLCVQWHPERLAQTQPENPFTKYIRMKFLEAIQNNKHSI